MTLLGVVGSVFSGGNFRYGFSEERLWLACMLQGMAKPISPGGGISVTTYLRKTGNEEWKVRNSPADCKVTQECGRGESRCSRQWGSHSLAAHEEALEAVIPTVPMGDPTLQQMKGRNISRYPTCSCGIDLCWSRPKMLRARKAKRTCYPEPPPTLSLLCHSKGGGREFSNKGINSLIQ